MRVPEQPALPMIELATRDAGSLHVTLFWHRATDLFTISVDDGAVGDQFELVVDGNPLDIYYHPYAYAALRGVAYGVAA